jgi:hypothetical protein
MAEESIMGIARDLTVVVLDKLAASGSAETYGERIGRLYRAVLVQVEQARNEIVTIRQQSALFSDQEPAEIEKDEE